MFHVKQSRPIAGRTVEAFCGSGQRLAETAWRPGSGAMTMSMTILCPKLTCRAVLRVPEKVRGQRVRCGECGTPFIVPGGNTAPAPRKGKSDSQEQAGSAPVGR